MNIHPYCYGNRRGIHIETEGGWGEAAPLPGFSKETYEEALHQLQHLDKAATLFPSVAFALDTATHPVEGHDVNIAHFGNDNTFHECIKLKLGPLSLEEAIEAVHNARAHCKQLRVDMNRMWPLEKAQAFCERFPEDTFAFIEEPTKDLLQLETRHPIAIDEHLREWEIAQAMRYPYVVIKPTMMGGYNELLPLITACKENGVTPVLSSSYETEIGLQGIIGLHKRFGLDDTPVGIDTLKVLR